MKKDDNQQKGIFFYGKFIIPSHKMEQRSPDKLHCAPTTL